MGAHDRCGCRRPARTRASPASSIERAIDGRADLPAARRHRGRHRRLVELAAGGATRRSRGPASTRRRKRRSWRPGTQNEQSSVLSSEFSIRHSPRPRTARGPSGAGNSELREIQIMKLVRPEQVLERVLEKVVEVRDDEVAALLLSDALLLPAVRRLLHHPAAARRDGHGRRGSQPAPGCSPAPCSRCWWSTPLYAALVARLPRRAVHPAGLPLLRRQSAALLRPARRSCPPSSSSGSAASSSSGPASSTCSWCRSSGRSWPTCSAPSRAKRLFGFIAVGGTLGGGSRARPSPRCWPDALGAANLLLVTALLLELAVRASGLLIRDERLGTGPPSSRASSRSAAARWPGSPAVLRSPYLLGDLRLHAALHDHLDPAVLPAGRDRPGRARRRPRRPHRLLRPHRPRGQRADRDRPDHPHRPDHEADRRRAVARAAAAGVRSPVSSASPSRPSLGRAGGVPGAAPVVQLRHRPAEPRGALHGAAAGREVQGQALRSTPSSTAPATRSGAWSYAAARAIGLAMQPASPSPRCRCR